MRDPAAAGEHNPSLVLFCCCFALFIVTMDNTIANVALPSIQRSLGANQSSLQWVVDAYVLVRGSLLLSAGAVGDRLGRRRLFQVGLTVFTVGSLLCSAAPSPGLLIAFRVVQALGGAMLTPSTLAIVAATFPDPGQRARALGFWGATTGVSTALGPVIGGALVEAVGWRSVFWVNVPIAVVAFMLSVRVIRESRAERPRRLDLPGQFLVVALLATLTGALIEGPEMGFRAPLVLTLFAVACTSLLLFVAGERRAAQPLIDLRYFHSPPFTGAAMVALVAFVAVGGFTFFNTLYLQQVRGASALHAGLLTLPVTAGMLISAPLSGRITARFGPRIPVTAACLLLVAALLVLANVTPSSPITELLEGYVLLGCGAGLVNPPITNAAVSGMPRDQAGVASATTSTARQVGTLLGVALLGSFVFGGHESDTLAHTMPAAFTAGLRHAYLLAGGLAMLGAGVGLFAMGKRSELVAPPEATPRAAARGTSG